MVEAHIEKLIDKSFGLNEEQRPAVLERLRDVMVTAGAGSGKTLTLVARYTSLLAEGLSPRRIAAITFSTKAAREMRSRVRTKLMDLQQIETDPELRQRWVDLSAQMDSARIGTIHSLCAEILRSHPAEAGIDPRFDVVDESLSAALRQQAVDDTLKLMAEEEKYTPLLYNIAITDLTSMLSDLLNKRLEAVEAFKITVDQHALIAKALRARMENPLISAPIEELRNISQNPTYDATDLVLTVNELLDLWDKAKSYLAEESAIECACALYELRRNHLNLNNWRKFTDEKAIARELQQNFDALIDPLTGGKGSQDPLPSQQTEDLAGQLLPLLREAFDAVRQAYQALLDARQALDFDDLEGRAMHLLRREDIKQHWKNELDAVLVDEFQDTNQRQREIVEHLAGKPGKLFIVGDMRQSIYRFRQADVTVFREVQERINAEGGLLVDLNLTYRAHQPLLDGMGTLLAGVIGTKPIPAKPYYIPYTPMIAKDKLPPEGIQPPHVEFILGAGEDSESARSTAARALAQRLLALKEEDQIKQWDDVTLLFQASTGFADYEEALQEAGIPFVTVAGRGFYDRPEIRDLLNILRALADPQDDLAFAGMLRSPAFGLTDAALFLLRQMDESYHQAIKGDLSCLGEPDRERAERASQIIGELLPIVDRVPVAELIKIVVDRLDYRAILASADTPQSQQDVATTGGRLHRNLDKLLNDAMTSEQVILRNYLEMIKTLNDAGAREGEAPAEAQGAVSLMTIHKAKGLEFKVVVLAAAGRATRSSSELAYLNQNLGVTLKLDPPPMLYNLSKHLDQDQDEMEKLRLLYVALTRAKQKLIISGHAKQNKEGDFAFYKWEKDLIQTAGLDSTDFEQAAGEPFTFQADTRNTYYAWCAQQDFTFSHTEMLEPDQKVNLKIHEVPLYPPIVAEKEHILEDKIDEAPDRQSWRATGSEQYLPGKQLGNLVHRAIQRWLFPGDPRLMPLLEMAALEAGLASDAARQNAILRAIELLARLQADPVWEEINNAQERFHELPYTCQLNGQPQTRVIDLLYRDVNGWHIIDFKTDPIETPQHREELIQHYSKQVRGYRNAIWQLLHVEADALICFLDDDGKIRLVEV